MDLAFDFESDDKSSRQCEVCRGLERVSLFRQRFASMEAGLLRGYDVVACRKCGFVFADGIPDQKILDVYYREVSKYENGAAQGQESEQDMNRFRTVADFVSPFIRSRCSRILDIGCSTGGFLSVLKDRGFAQVEGIDPSPGCARAAQRLHGIGVRTCALTDLRLAEGSVDFCAMMHVLEHIREMADILGRVRSCLAEAGRIYVEVPDAASFNRSRNAPFQEFSVEHINFFGPTALNNIMGAAGFTPVVLMQAVREYQPGTYSPVICAVYEKRRSIGFEWMRDEVTSGAVLDYVRQCQDIETGTRRILDEIAQRGESILIWGVGSLTLRLLETGVLAGIRIAGFVDSNPKYQGQRLGNAAVLAPDEIRGRSEAILVSSWVYQREIVKQIRDKLRMSNPLFLLYEV